MSANPMTELFGEIIHSYTRAEGIADGFLVEAPADITREYFKIPVAFTSTAWADCVAWTEQDAENTGCYQEQDARLRDVLMMALFKARGSSRSDRITFQMVRVRRDARHDEFEDGIEAEEITLVMVCGPGDTGEPVLTVMLPHED